jgi:hypothetical protein
MDSGLKSAFHSIRCFTSVRSFLFHVFPHCSGLVFNWLHFFLADLVSLSLLQYQIQYFTRLFELSIIRFPFFVFRMKSVMIGARKYAIGPDSYTDYEWLQISGFTLAPDLVTPFALFPFGIL